MVISSYFPILNTAFPNQYLRALIVFVILYIIIHLALIAIRKISLYLTKKTKTDLDDRVVSGSSKPLTIIALLISVKLTLLEITFSEFVNLTTDRIIYTILAITIGYLAYKLLDIILIEGWERVTRKAKLNVGRDLSNMIKTILKVTFIAIIALLILDLWGIEIGPLLAGLGIAGLAVALALQPVLANIFSGMSMILDKSVRIGDWLILDDGTWGIIEKISIRSTKIRNFDNELITVPNSKLADSHIHNVAMPDPVTRVVIPFSVAYGSDIDLVKSVVMKEIKQLKHFISDPAPKVRFLEFGDSSLNFKAFFFVDSYENRYDSIDEANTRIYKALGKAGIEIPFPQRDIHIKSDSTERKGKKK